MEAKELNLDELRDAAGGSVKEFSNAREEIFMNIDNLFAAGTDDDQPVVKALYNEAKKISTGAVNAVDYLGHLEQMKTMAARLEDPVLTNRVVAQLNQWISLLKA